MSVFSTIAATLAPGWALKRERARQQLSVLRGYDAAQQGRRTNSFRRSAGSANAEVSRALGSLRDRSSELVRNSWIGPRVLDILTAHVVGTDLTVRFDTGADRADKAAKEAFEEWVKTCDTTGEMHFNGVVALAFRSMLERGDSIIRMVDRRIDSMPRGRVPFQLFVGEGDLIDESRDSAAAVGRDERARLGVRLGDYDERLGYWLHTAPPSETGALRLAPQSTFVERAQVCHLHRIIRPGLVRGVPIFAPVLMSARDYADLIDALVIKARMEACIGLVIESADSGMSLGQKVADAANTSGPSLEKLRPGMVPRLNPGEKAFAFAPAGNTAFDPISRATLMGIAAGVGITYDQLTGDLTRANYSSLRAGKIEFRRLVADLQWNLLVPQVLDRIVARFVDRAVLAGRLKPRRDGYRHLFVMPAHEPIDPKKDLEADILAVRAGRMSPQDFIEAWGRDWREVVAEYEAFLKDTDARGLVFDFDARNRTRTGQDNGGAPVDPEDDDN